MSHNQLDASVYRCMINHIPYTYKLEVTSRYRPPSTGRNCPKKPSPLARCESFVNTYYAPSLRSRSDTVITVNW